MNSKKLQKADKKHPDTHLVSSKQPQIPWWFLSVSLCYKKNLIFNITNDLKA